jgi:hypothetical protein
VKALGRDKKEKVFSFEVKTFNFNLPGPLPLPRKTRENPDRN